LARIESHLLLFEVFSGFQKPVFWEEYRRPYLPLSSPKRVRRKNFFRAIIHAQIHQKQYAGI
jgi:hypothetical protein